MGVRSVPGSEMSAIRRGLLWWFGGIENPWVTVNVAIDFANAQAYLASLPPPKVTVNHLVAAAIGRTLGRFPEANAHVVNRRIVQPEHVGIAMPVNLIGHKGGPELAVTILERAETLTLREVATTNRREVAEERRGNARNPLVRRVMKVIEASPQRVVEGTLSLLDRASRRERLGGRLFELVPVTTALSNAGAAVGDLQGMLFRGGDIAIPKRLVRIGTFWGTSAIQDEVVAVNGVPTVRPMLPVLFLFDHRLIDGVKASRVLTCFGGILRDPAREFGSDGSRPPCDD